jgi:hypothetical protein
MCCGTPVAQRTYIDVQSKLDARKTIPMAIIQKLSNWREISVDLSDGSYTNLKICKACVNVNISDHLDKIMSQITRGWDKELDDTKANEHDRKRHHKRIKGLKITGRSRESLGKP